MKESQNETLNSRAETKEIKDFKSFKGKSIVSIGPIIDPKSSSPNLTRPTNIVSTLNYVEKLSSNIAQ